MKPILFNTEMVRAILDGRKTVTRRVVKPQPECYGPNLAYPHTPAITDVFLSAEKGYLQCRRCGHYPEYSAEGIGTLHYWKPSCLKGDILYVRETWNEIDDLPYDNYVYRADDESPEGWHLTAWRPSIHMPKEAARIFLQVTDIRVERLQEITVDDVISEGIDIDFPATRPSYLSLAYAEMHLKPAFLDAFKTLWNNTVKKQDIDKYGWNANPWVWVIEFEKISKEEAYANF